MKTLIRISIVTVVLGFMVMADIPRLPVQLVPEAEAIFGVRRRAFRRGVIIGAAAESSAKSQSDATAPQQSATTQKQPATAQQQAETAKQQAAAETPPDQPAAGGKPLPLGTVFSALPGGCTKTPVGGVEYYYCSGNFYRAAFQGNQLVYVTTKPE